MDWDASVFTVTGVADMSFLGSTGRTVIPLGPDIGDGTLTFAAASVGAEPGPDGIGPLAVISMTATGVGTSLLDLHDVTVFDTAAASEIPVIEDGTAESTKEAVAFQFGLIDDQVAGAPFAITITAIDEDDACAPNYEGMAALTDSTGTMTPNHVLFEGCTVTETVTIIKAQADVTITAESMTPTPLHGVITGTSNAFDVAANVPFTLALTADPISLTVGMTSTLTATAEDQFQNPVTDGTEVVFQSDLGSVGSSVVTKTTTAGVATAALYSEVAGTATVEAKADSVTDTVQVVFNPSVIQIFIPIIAKSYTP
jgi:hypothetical protein